MWVGFFKSWIRPYWDGKLSSLAPSGVVLSVEHRLLNLAWKSPMMTVRKGFFCVSGSSVKSKLINSKPAYIVSFSDKPLNYVGQLFDYFGKIKQWNNLKTEFYLCEKTCFAFMQLVHSLLSALKKITETNGSVTTDLLLNNQIMRNKSK